MKDYYNSFLIYKKKTVFNSDMIPDGFSISLSLIKLRAWGKKSHANK